jgi:hypothetical protein
VLHQALEAHRILTTRESLYSKVEHQASEDISSSAPGEHSVFRCNVFEQSGRNWTNAVCRLVEEVDPAILGSLNTGNTQVEGLCSGAQETILEKLACT